MAEVSYICGWTLSEKDAKLFDLCNMHVNGELTSWPNLKRWFDNIKSYTLAERLKFPALNRENCSLTDRVDRLIKSAIPGDKNLEKKVRQ